MIKLRKILIKLYFGPIMGCLVLYCSCTKDRQVANAIKGTFHALTRNSSYTDRDVFRGVMFLDGPVASNYLSDEYTNLNYRSFCSDTSRAYHRGDSVINLIVTAFDTTYPGWLSNFRDKIGSGDYDTVKDIVERTGSKLYTMLASNVSHQYIDTNYARVNDSFFAVHTGLSKSTTLSNLKDTMVAAMNTVHSGGPIKLPPAPAPSALETNVSLDVDWATMGYVTLTWLEGVDMCIAFIFLIVIFFLAFFVFGLKPGQPGDEFNDYIKDKICTDVTANLTSI